MLAVSSAVAFTTFSLPQQQNRLASLGSSAPSDTGTFDLTVDDIKTDLVRCCTRQSKPLLDEVKRLVQELEEKAELVSPPMSDFGWYTPFLTNALFRSLLRLELDNAPQVLDSCQENGRIFAFDALFVLPK
jgi:hypothetical protein